MTFTRRSFIKLIAAVLASGATAPAFSKPRDPYVRAGEVADYIGPTGSGFCGGQIICSVGAWDGVGYPVTCRNNGYGRYAANETYYDFDLAAFRREIPKDFWLTHSMQDWPNVHTWIRTQRYGETIEQAMRKLNFAGVRPPRKRIA